MMADIKKKEVIIVGGGPSGLATAKLLADNNIDTLLITRSNKEISKSFYSSLVFEQSLKGIFGGVSEGKDQAPIERFLSKQKSFLLDRENFSCIDLNTNNENNFIVLRSAFSAWMAKQIEKAGATILYDELVKDLIIENGIVKGVITENDSYHSNTVVMAEGSKGILSKKCGLRKGDYTPDELYLFVEEVIELPSKSIEQRFEIDQGQGVSIILNPYEFFKMESTGFINTNKKSISVGVGVLFSDLIKNNVNVNYCIEGIKIHPGINPFIKGGETIKYNSYILPKKVWSKDSGLKKLYGNGYLIVGGCGNLIDIKSPDITNLSFISSKIACETIIKSKELNDYSMKALSLYQKLIESKIEIIKPKEEIKS